MIAKSISEQEGDVSITKFVADRITNYDSSKSIASRLRAKRAGPLLEMIEEVYNEYGHVNIVDIGGTEKYWNIIPKQYLDDKKVNITLVNIPGGTILKDHDNFVFIEADGCNLEEFDDKSFHISHSNSVLEHVGDWDRMVLFAREISRVSIKYFIQTPNYWFPIEPHSLTPFFHWLPKPARIWLVLHFQLGHWKRAITVDEAVRIVESARLLNKKMLQELFSDGVILTEWFFF